MKMLTGLLLILGLARVSQAVVPAAERQALIDLYNGTTGAGWVSDANWRNAGDTDFNVVGTECSWYGITCNGAGDSVVQISLTGNNLSGNIPASIQNLPGLTTIGVASNPAITGSIPPEIGTLAQLQGLDAYGCGWSGSIPAELGNLSSLTNLNLCRNDLDGNIPPELGNLSNLWWLLLEGNQLSGSIPPELCNLSSLTSLALDNNSLSGSIHPQLGNLSNLTALALDNNWLSGSIPAGLGNLSSLTTLSLYTNDLTGSIPAEFGSLSNLFTMDLHNNVSLRQACLAAMGPGG